MIPKKYDMETDVVIVGYGGAGAAAAIAAHDNGASVIILEKLPEPFGNTRVSAGNMAIPKNSEKFAQYLKTICFRTTEPEIIDAFVQGLTEIPGWIREMGGELRKFVFPQASCAFFIPNVTFPDIPGAGDVDIWCVKETDAVPEPTGGLRLFSLLKSQVERRGIKVMLSTPAKELIQNEKREIAGVIAKSRGKNISIKARKGVILTCGGFQNNHALKWDNLIPKPLCFTGSPGNTGDGISMAQKVGAALWHMGASAMKFGFKAPEYEAAFSVDFLGPGFIYVDKYGRRFADETKIEHHRFWEPLSVLDYNRFEYPRVPFYAIFDEEIRCKAPLCWAASGYVLVVDKYNWSPDNSVEIKKGWIIKAETISELAEQLSMDESNLKNTIAKYNECCKVGKDTNFGRTREKLKAIEKPYYAIQLWPTLVNTQGGPRRDKEARALDPDGKPIPGLYAAGELGSIWGFRYQTSTNLSECLVFGRIAGRNAATSPLVES